MSDRYAILLDGGFVTKVLGDRQKSFPEAKDVIAECDRISKHPSLQGISLLRYYYYDAPPLQKTVTNPLSRDTIDLGTTKVARRNQALQNELELSPNFAFRRGETVLHGWRLGHAATLDMQKNQRTPVAKDFVPDIQQKGVDLRIGLDIARLSLRNLVSIIVVVTGDSDFVPAFKFARREGIRIYLDHLGQSVNRELLAHTDLVL